MRFGNRKLPLTVRSILWQLKSTETRYQGFNLFNQFRTEQRIVFDFNQPIPKPFPIPLRQRWKSRALLILRMLKYMHSKWFRDRERTRKKFIQFTQTNGRITRNSQIYLTKYSNLFLHTRNRLPRETISKHEPLTRWWRWALQRYSPNNINLTSLYFNWRINFRVETEENEMLEVNFKLKL